MITNQRSTHEEIVALSQDTQKSMAQLQAIGALPLPSERYALVNKLINNSQTYLVFLEESAGQIKEGNSIDVGLLDAIKTHCLCVESAWADIKFKVNPSMD